MDHCSAKKTEPAPSDRKFDAIVLLQHHRLCTIGSASFIEESTDIVHITSSTSSIELIAKKLDFNPLRPDFNNHNFLSSSINIDTHHQTIRQLRCKQQHTSTNIVRQ
jgi:hypothetical protein